MAEFRISDEDWDTPLEEEDLFEVPASTAYQNLNAAAQGDADSYAKDLEISKRTGVPVDAIPDNRDEVALRDATALIKEEDWNKPLTELENPGVAKYLEDPDAARVSFDDISILTGLENEGARSWIEFDKRVFQGLGDSMMIGMGKTYDEVAILMLNEMKRGEGKGLFSIGAGGDPIHAAISKARDSALMAMEGDEATQEWNDELDRKIQGHRQNLEFAEGLVAELTPEGLTVAEEGIRGGVQMVADMAPGLAISIGTRGKFNPTLGYLTGKTFLSSYGSAVVAGQEHRTAMQYATIDAALEYATERLPTKRLEKIIGETGTGAGIKSGLKRWLVGEALGEQVATATQSINAYAHELDEELADAYKIGWPEVLEVQGRRQAVTFISTLVGGGSMAGTIKSVDYLANRERRAMGKIIQATNKRRGAEFEQERLDNMIYLAQASKTNKRAKDQFEKFMDGAAPDQVVFMSAEAVDLLDTPPGYILEQMDGSGGDVAIPLATFLKDFANDEAKLELVRPFIKTSEGLSTKTELEEDNDGEYIKALLAKAAEATETKTTADEIYERITAQLVATGRQSAATARQSAAIVTAQVTTQYEYLKSIGFKKEDGTEVTLEELFADFGLEIVGPATDVAADFMTQADESVAAEYEQAAAKGLDVSVEGRQARAEEQGFDTRQAYYHFTQADFDEFSPLSHFGGPIAAADRQAFTRGAITSEFDETFEDRGLDEGWVVRDNEGNTYGENLTEEEADVMQQQIMREQMGAAVAEDTDAGARTIPVYAKVNNPLRIEDTGAFHTPNELISQMLLSEEFTQAEVDAVTVRQGMPSRNNIIELMKSKGFDGFIYQNKIEGPGTDSIIPLEANQMRSVNAAFDPDFTDSPSMLAQQGDAPMEVLAGRTVTLEDGRTYEVQKTDPDHTLVLVDAALLEDLWVDKVGKGPEYKNQISNRIKQYKEHLERYDRGTFINREGKEVRMPKENLQVGNAFVRGPEPGYSGYISFGDGRHRARVMLEQGLQRIPVSMDSASIAGLREIVAAREPGRVSPEPRVLAQQNFSTIELVDQRVDQAGNALEITENAGELWKIQQDREENINKLRNCLRA